jgi:hypothetical protein
MPKPKCWKASCHQLNRIHYTAALKSESWLAQSAGIPCGSFAPSPPRRGRMCGPTNVRSATQARASRSQSEPVRPDRARLPQSLAKASSNVRDFIAFWVQNSVHAGEQYGARGGSQTAGDLANRCVGMAVSSQILVEHPPCPKCTIRMMLTRIMPGSCRLGFDADRLGSIPFAS